MEKIDKKYIYTIVSTFILAFIFHGYMFLNKFAGRDDTDQFDGIFESTRQGRWGYTFFRKIYSVLLGPALSMPWIIGCFTTFYLVIGAVLVIRIYKIDSKIFCMMIGGLLVGFPTVTSIYAYMSNARFYILSILLAIVAAAVLIKKSDIKNEIFAVFLLVTSISIYQAYIGLATGILVLKLIDDCIEGQEFVTVVKKGVRYVVTLIVSLVLYLTTTKVLLAYFGMELTEYQNMNSMGQVSLASLIDGSLQSYQVIPKICFGNYMGLTGTVLSRLVTTIVIVVLCVFIIWNVIQKLKNKDIKEAGLLVALSLMFPIAVNVVFLTNPGLIHSVMLYSMVLYYVAAVLVCNKVCAKKVNVSITIEQIRSKKISKYVMYYIAVIVMIVLLLLSYCYISNATYTKMQLAHSQAQSYFNTIVTQIKSLDGYSDEYKIIYYGKPQDQSLTRTDKELFDEITLMGATTSQSLVGMRFRDKYLEYYCGFTLETTTASEAGISQEAIADMPCYPNKGAIQILNNTIVVKFENKDYYK